MSYVVFCYKEPFIYIKFFVSTYQGIKKILFGIKYLGVVHTHSTY